MECLASGKKNEHPLYIKNKNKTPKREILWCLAITLKKEREKKHNWKKKSQSKKNGTGGQIAGEKEWDLRS